MSHLCYAHICVKGADKKSKQFSDHISHQEISPFSVVDIFTIQQSKYVSRMWYVYNEENVNCTEMQSDPRPLMVSPDLEIREINATHRVFEAVM